MMGNDTATERYLSEAYENQAALTKNLPIRSKIQCSYGGATSAMTICKRRNNDKLKGAMMISQQAQE